MEAKKIILVTALSFSETTSLELRELLNTNSSVERLQVFIVDGSALFIKHISFSELPLHIDTTDCDRFV